MGFLERSAGQQLAGEGSGEGIAGTDGICNLDMRGQQGGDFAILGSDGAERGTAGQNDVLEVEAVDEPLTCLFVIALRNGEHVAHHDQLFVVDLEDVRVVEQLFDELIGVEVGAQVDVEELQCAFLGFVAIGQSFVVLWGGGEQFRIDYWTALLLFFACLWTNIQTVGIEIQRAKNMHKYRSLVYLGVLVGNIIISIPLCMKWEGFGAAIGTAVATLVGNVFLMNRYYHRHIGLNIPAFWRHIFHLLPAMLPPAVTAVLLAVFVHPVSYWQLIPPGLLFVAVYAASMWLFGMNRYERGLIAAPLRRILHR